MEEKKIICDTDVVIDFWDEKQGRHSITRKILEQNIGLNQVVISAITKMELISGASNKSDLEKMSTKLSRFNIALINNDITLKAFELQKKYFLSHGLSMPDCLIASTSIILGLELFTYNTKDFKFISDLTLYKG